MAMTRWRPVGLEVARRGGARGEAGVEDTVDRVEEERDVQRILAISEIYSGDACMTIIEIAGEEIARLEARGVGVSAGCEAGGGGSTDIRARAWAGDRLSWAATGPKQDTILFVAEISEQDVALRKVYLGSLNYVPQSAKDNGLS
uniref:Expressed protein n=1 Tax=Oryza sativa subsp. japonica TaxID=39947 RepID=Q2QM97_ORYSJ|nr:expressed protein [Oryza sativa Japonica Group]